MLKISIIQTNLIWKDKKANLQNIQEKINDLKTDLIILPETFTTGFCNDTSLAEGYDETYEWMINISKEKNCAICGSFLFKEEDKFYNRMFFITPDSIEKYDKRHIFKFGGEEQFTSGNTRKIVNYKGFKINLNICYDLRFPVWTRQAYKNEYDILINIANWPAARSRTWTTLLKARAIENQCVVIGANRIGYGNGLYYSGDSSIVNPFGEILLTSNKDEILNYTINKKALESFRSEYPFLDDMDNFYLN